MAMWSPSYIVFTTLLVVAVTYSNDATALQISPPPTNHQKKLQSRLTQAHALHAEAHHEISRRTAAALIVGTTTAASSLADSFTRPPPAVAKGVETTIAPAIPSNPSSSRRKISTSDPSPNLPIRGRGANNESSVKIPRIGYSFYKTPSSQATRCTSLALTAGIRHLDIATQYGSNRDIATSLKRYLDVGVSGLDIDNDVETVDVLERLELARQSGETHTNHLLGLTNQQPPPPIGSTGRQNRRDTLFLSHKLSNNEQSTNPTQIRKSIQQTITTLGVKYLDMVSIHSPLTDPTRRLTTYRTLLEMQEDGLIRSVGVCNYGVGPLRELREAGLRLPAVNQLELSPFNTHAMTRNFCETEGIALGCGAWSKLSGVNGPTDGWNAVCKLAAAATTRRTKMGVGGVVTPAQVLVRWSLQKGYVCVPRSGVGSIPERLAIGENSYGGVNEEDFVLSAKEMKVLDGLDVEYTAGRLGRRDGWEDSDVGGLEWDPTDVV